MTKKTHIVVPKSVLLLALEACEAARPYLLAGSLAAEENMQLASCCTVLMGGESDKTYILVSKSLLVLALEACDAARPYLPAGRLAAEENMQLASCCIVLMGGDSDSVLSWPIVHDLDNCEKAI